MDHGLLVAFFGSYFQKFNPLHATSLRTIGQSVVVACDFRVGISITAFLIAKRNRQQTLGYRQQHIIWG